MSNPSSIHAPEATVGAIILRHTGDEPEVLLTRRGYPPFKDHWCLPGGHIDINEPARQAITREVKEEVGLDFMPRFFTYFDEIIPALKLHAVVLIFDGSYTGNIKTQPGEVTETGWYKFSQAINLQLAFHHRKILTDYMKVLGE